MTKKHHQEAIYHCDVCKKEIPRSAARTAEGKDYTWHFCGTPCHKKWENQQK